MQNPLSSFEESGFIFFALLLLRNTEILKQIRHHKFWSSLSSLSS